MSNIPCAGTFLLILLVEIGVSAGAPTSATGTGQIYITGDIRGSVVRVNDMTGAGWTKGSDDFAATGIFVDASGRIYVTDSSYNRIMRMNDVTGAGWTTLGTSGTGVNQFGTPRGIFVDEAGRIYVADTSNRRIVRVNDITGAGWTALGTEGSGVNQFGTPPGFLWTGQAGSTWRMSPTAASCG